MQPQFIHAENEKTGCARLRAKDCIFIFEMGGTPISRRRKLRQQRTVGEAGGLWLAWLNWGL